MLTNFYLTFTGITLAAPKATKVHGSEVMGLPIRSNCSAYFRSLNRVFCARGKIRPTTVMPTFDSVAMFQKHA